MKLTSARRRGGRGPPAQIPFIPGAPRLGSSEGGKDVVMQLHLPCSLSSSWAMHNSALPRLLQKPGQAASSSGGPHAHTQSLCPRGGGTTRHVTAPSPKGWVSLGQRGAQHVPCPLCIQPGLGGAAHRAGGQDPGDPWLHTSSAWLPAAAQVNGTSTVGRAAPVTRDRTEPARGRTASRRGCEHLARHHEAHVGSGA